LGLLGEVRDADGFYLCSATIRSANWFEKLLGHWEHPNPMYRVPLQISLVSLGCGLIGMILGFVSLVD